MFWVEGKRYFTTEEASQELDLSISSFSRYLRDGKLPEQTIVYGRNRGFSDEYIRNAHVILDGDSRSNISFRRMFRWHLENGTRPSTKRSNSKRPWTFASFAKALRVGNDIVLDWAEGTSLPSRLIFHKIEKLFFGENWPEDRRILRSAHAKALTKKVKTRKGSSSSDLQSSNQSRAKVIDKISRRSC